jgi:glycosyltransferase involved in cell wall biosynthesis
VSRYFTRLANELHKLEQDVKIFAGVHRNKYVQNLPKQLVIGKKTNTSNSLAIKIYKSISDFYIPIQIENWNPEIIHETYYSSSPIKSKKSFKIITIYDMIHELFTDNFDINDQTSLWKKKSIETADHIISISNNTKNDLINLFKIPEDKISVVHLAADVLGDKNTLPLTSNKPYLLYVGARRGYKNFDSFLKAISISKNLKNDFKVIAFGGGIFTKIELDYMYNLGFGNDDIIQMDGDDQLLASLYKGATSFIYPSKYEGFGLPLIESMALGCPVITSNISSMPEIVGHAGIYFDPLDIYDISQKIEDVVYSETLTDELIKKGYMTSLNFTWQKCALETLSVYKNKI